MALGGVALLVAILFRQVRSIVLVLTSLLAGMLWMGGAGARARAEAQLPELRGVADYAGNRRRLRGEHLRPSRRGAGGERGPRAGRDRERGGALLDHDDLKQIYAQVIDDEKGVTLAAASTLEKALRDGLKTGADVKAAHKVGKEVAERAKKAGVTSVVFDRAGYLYHGRVKALAEGAREGGLEF